MGLTVKRVQKLLRRGDAGIYPDGGKDHVRGLRLCVRSKTAASWELRFQLNHVPRLMGLGSARVFTLAEARAPATAAKKQLTDKIDPLEQRRSERAARKATLAAAKAAAVEAKAKSKTFREAAETYIADHRKHWKNDKHAAQWPSSLARFAYPVIGDMRVADVDTTMVLKVLEQAVPAGRGDPAGSLWNARRDTASRVRGRIETILNWSTIRGFRSGSNPAAWEGHLEHALADTGKVEVAHHAAVPYEELPAFMAALAQRVGVAARALEFTILTAARTGEVIGATWDEIDLEKNVWTIPGERMKAGKRHTVPLSPAAVALLQSLPREGGNPHLFIGPRGPGLSNMAMAQLMKRMDRSETVHGFRSTFMDWAHDRTAFPAAVIDMALAHGVKDKTEKAYRRGDLIAKREALMDAWATYCNSPPVERSGKVVPLKGGAAS
jgi:integrase